MLMDLQDSNEVVAIHSGRGKLSLLQMMNEECQKIGYQLFPLKIIMPCGCEVEYNFDSFPERSVDCKCGNPDHKVVEYWLH